MTWRNLLRLAGAAAILWMPHAFGAAAVDGTNLSSNTNTSSGTSFTVSTLTVASGDNLLEVFVEAYFPVSVEPTFSSVTWNGQALTYGGREQNPLNGTESVDFEVWYLVNPTAATGSLVATATTNLGGSNFYSFIPISGANTTSPIGTVSGGNSTTVGNLTITATGGVAGDLYTGAFATNGTSVVQGNANGTNHYNVSGYSVDTIPGADAGSFQWTSSGGTNATGIALAVKASSGGGSCTHAGITSAGAIAVPNGTSGLYRLQSGSFGTPDCSTVQYYQTRGDFGVN